MSEYRHFAIPGNGSSVWDPEIHGHEVDEVDLGSGDVTEIDWKPGEYSFSIGSAGATIDVRLPESSVATYPQERVLRGFHEFLKFAYDPDVANA